MENLASLTESPATMHKSQEELIATRQAPLILKHSCHNQTVERHIKAVSEASAAVATFERRDGMIRQRLKSRKLLKKLNTTLDSFPAQQLHCSKDNSTFHRQRRL